VLIDPLHTPETSPGKHGDLDLRAAGSHIDGRLGHEPRRLLPRLEQTSSLACGEDNRDDR
jgi:hypothetical protein